MGGINEKKEREKKPWLFGKKNKTKNLGFFGLHGMIF